MPSSTNVPSSISRSRRSRAVSLSRACCAAILSGPPPCLIFSRRARRSSASGRNRLVEGASVAIAASETSYFLLCHLGGRLVKLGFVAPARELGVAAVRGDPALEAFWCRALVGSWPPRGTDPVP